MSEAMRPLVLAGSGALDRRHPPAVDPALVRPPAAHRTAASLQPRRHGGRRPARGCSRSRRSETSSVPCRAGSANRWLASSVCTRTSPPAWPASTRRSTSRRSGSGSSAGRSVRSAPPESSPSAPAVPPAVAVLFLVGAPLLGFLIVEQSVSRASQRWQRHILLELPVVSEQIGMLLSAGFSLGTAINRVASRGSGCCAQDLRSCAAGSSKVSVRPRRCRSGPICRGCRPSSGSSRCSR